jgi:PPK2 family polyphosphate:nucleotide phosphotransferase
MLSGRPASAEGGNRSLGDRLRVRGRVALGDIDTRATPGTDRRKAQRELEADRKHLAELQARLFAEGSSALLLILQGLDASGKDGTIKHVIGAVNPLGCRITSFRPPTDEEAGRHFLWRIRRVLPRPGEMGIFNRSHYEDVLVPRVHGAITRSEWESRYQEINSFEAELAGRGTTVVKVFLLISREEQRERLLQRLDDPTKRWKFDPGDLDERARWDEYLAAYEDAFAHCSSDPAPWYVLPADRKWYRNWAVARLLVETLDEMEPHYPQPELDLEALRARLATP